MGTRTFTRQQMLDVLDEGPIEDRQVGHRRWSVDHEIVFAHDGKHYKAEYSVGATESQDETPWQDDETVDATEVHEVERVVKAWEPV